MPSLTPASLRLRSVLFAPADQPALIPKIARTVPDAAILDLEDAVAPGDKAAARALARQGAATLAATLPVFIRVNSLDSEWFAADIAEALVPGLAGIVVPKIAAAADVARVRAALEAAEATVASTSGAGISTLPIIAGVETALGVVRVDEIAQAGAGVLAVYFGAEDFIADMGGERTRSGHEVAYGRARVVLAARAAGILALDQVVVDFRDGERFSAEAQQARELGYAGKLCIHPTQVALANVAFTPTEAAIDRSRRVLAAYAAGQREHRGVVNYAGQMIDVPLLVQARAVLARAGLTDDTVPAGQPTGETA